MQVPLRLVSALLAPVQLALTLLFCLCGPAMATHEAGDDDRLRVLVWNAWRGGNEVDLGPEKVLEVVRSVDPDVVLMQESYDIDGERPTLGRWVAAE
ncbi:MAG: endonuclease/exonuclease/phosphatase family protein, partial [Planctomycetota bacterium]